MRAHVCNSFRRSQIEMDVHRAYIVWDSYILTGTMAGNCNFCASESLYSLAHVALNKTEMAFNAKIKEWRIV